MAAGTLPKHDVRALGAAFGIKGEFLEAAAYSTGHINDTYASVYDQAGSKVRYIHQRINHNVFKDPARLMDNIHRVTLHQLSKLGSPQGDLSRRALQTLTTASGLPYYKDSEGNFWRTYLFIEKAKTYDIIENTRQAFEAAKAFGAFQGQLADLPGGRLHETIANFHNTPWRFQNFEKAVKADRIGRLPGVKAEADFALSQKEKVGRLLSLSLPERITHNDTKLNNVMLDDQTGEGVCVIDLDTVMPGLGLYDFGDMVRTATVLVKE